MINQFVNKAKEDIVLLISFILALITSFISLPKIEYIDFKVLISLFNLMLIVEAFEKLKILEMISIKILDKFNNERTVSLALILITFFLSMFVTNDVALITLVPITLIISKKSNINPLEIIILQTLSANIGSSLTPMGNPQNLFLYSKFNINTIEFVKTMLPFASLGFLFLAIINFIIPNKKINFYIQEIKIKDTKKALIFVVMFIIILLSIFNVLNYKIAFIITLILTLFLDKTLFKEVDYTLLLTFIFFFIFIGNLSHFDIIKNTISMFLNKEKLTYLSSIILSQFISNVPCAIFISGFSKNYKELLLGVNIGGMGTLIASLASVISYKFYIENYKNEKKKYLLKFSMYNFIFLFIFTVIFWFFI